MQALLYLTHRIPYPPNKGDKIRSFHILQHLSQHYRVFLGTFVDDEQDWQHVDKVRSY
ncbi:MAG: sugar transferase, partial [Nitrosomonas sp.]